MSWLNQLRLNTFGDNSSLFSASFFSKNFARIVAVFIVLFAALPAKTEIEGPNEPSPDNVLVNVPSAAETFARWMQPSTAAAATRYRHRARGERAQAKKVDVVSEQSTATLAPLTPYIQIWPQAHSAKNDAPPEMAQVTTHDFMRVAEKADRLVPTSSSDEDDVVHANELSEIDLAATPPTQAVAFAATDGHAQPDASEAIAPANRFAAFADSVRAIPQAPWFESVLFVIAGVIAAFIGARVFMRA